MNKSCFRCAWLSDEFVAVCCNSDSPHCADYMDRDDSCECWKYGIPPKEFDKRSKEEWDNGTG